VPPHQLHYHDPLVRFRGGVEPTDRVGSNFHGRLEAEGHIRCCQIIVDRLWHANNWQSLLVKRVCDTEGSVSTDGDQRVDS
jgi:hypothetical protein